MLGPGGAALAAALALASAGALSSEVSPREERVRRPGLRASIEPVLDRLQEEAIEEGTGADPRNPFRFFTTIEVHAQTPEQLLARFLDGPDQRLARPPHSPPSVRDLDRFRTLGPQPDFVGLAREVARWLGGKGEPHYFLYRVIRDGRTTALLRETPLPASLLTAGRDGASFVPAGAFAGEDEAVEAYRRLSARLEREQEALDAAIEVAPAQR